MNVNSMYQMVGAIQKNPQVVGEAVAAGAGVGFEDMLQQASQKPANAAADKKPAQNNDNKADKNAQGSQNTQNAQGSQGSQGAQNAQSAQSSQGSQGTQDAQNPQDAQASQDAQALAAALMASPQVQMVSLEPETVAEQSAPLQQTVVAAAEVVQAYTQDPQTQNAANQAEVEVGAQAQTAAEQTTVLPPQTQTTGQNGQTAFDAQQQNMAQPAELTARQAQPEVARQPELKAAANTENALAGAEVQAEEGSEDAAAAAQTPIFGNGDAVPVKVMEAEQPYAPQADDAAEQLAQKINQALAQGESRLTLNLTPATLGNLTVEITRLADGTLSVILSAVTEKAAGLLEKHSGSLQSLLAGNMPGGNVRVEVENRTPEEAPQQFLNPDQQEREDGQQSEEQQNRRNMDDQAAQTDFMQQLRLGLINLNE